nr:type I secretion C-terminal target domain-containing protein [Endozoicomonas sp.]
MTSDGLVPAVYSISSITPDGEYAAGSTVVINVDFDAAVVVSGEPVLMLETGDKVRTARYTGGSNTQTLTFEYQVQDGDTSADLDVYGSSALRLNGGSIEGLYGNAASLTVPIATDSNALSSQSAIIIDGEAPGVTFASATLGEDGINGWNLTLSGDHFETMIALGEVLNPSLTLSGDELGIHFDWSKLDLNLMQPDGSFSSLDITAETVNKVLVYEDRLEVIFDEGAGLITDNAGLSSFSGDVRIAVDAGFILDAPGNAARMDTLAETDVSVTTSGATIDHITADTPDGGYGIGDEIVIRVRFSEVVELQNYDVSDPLILLLDDRLPDGQNPVGGNAVYESGSGTRELVFRHTISEGENIDDLNYRSTDALTFASDLGFATAVGNSLVYGSGTAASLTLPELDSTSSLAGSSDISVDTIVPIAEITGAAWDEGNNQLLILGSDFDTLLSNIESTTVDLTSRLDWSKITIDIDKDDGVTRDITLTSDDVFSAKLAGNETIAITLTDTKASELETIFGYRGAEDGVDITQGFLLDPSRNPTAQADIADLTLDYSDVASPLVTRVSLATPGHFKSGDEVVIQVEMSEVVNITGIDASDDSTKPTLALDNGGLATYTGGSGTSVLRFSYTVGADAGENTGSLNYTSANALTMPSGLSVYDGTGNSALTILPDIDSNDALGQSSLGVIDINAPTVSLVDSVAPDGTYKEGELIQIEIQIDEIVEVEGVPLLNMNTGGTATYASGSGSDTLIFNYIVQAGENVSNLRVATDAPFEPFDLTAGSIRDLAGNDLDVSNMPVNNDAQSFKSLSDIAIDTTLPEFDFQEASFAIRPQKSGSSFPAFMVLLYDTSKIVETEYDTNIVGGTSNPIEDSHLIDWTKIYIEYTDDHFNRQKLYLNDDVVELVYGSSSHILVSISIDLDYVIENGALSTWDYNTTGDVAHADETGHNPNNDGVTGFHTRFVMESGALPDAAGNINDTAIVKDLNNFYDRTNNAYWTDTQGSAAVSGAELLRALLLPEVTKVSFANTENQFYREGDEITINVHYNQVMRVRTHGDWPELQLSNGATATFDTSTLNSREAHDAADNTAFAGRVLKFTYTVQAGDDISSLGLEGVSPQITLNGAFVEHGYGLHQLNDGIGVDRDDPSSGAWDRTADLGLPAEGDENSLSAQLEVAISTTPPAATITDTFYDSVTGLLKIDGSGFEEILVGSATVETVRPVLDWTKLTYKVNGTDALTFTEDDITSARILGDNSILVQFSSVKMDAIAALTAGDVSDDLVDIAAGLVRDLAGNVSTTDGITGVAVIAADLKAPELNQAMVLGNDLALIFDESLAGTPAVDEFTVKVNGAERTLTTVDITDNTATLTFDGAAVTGSDQVIFDYSGSSLTDGGGNTATTISGGVAGYSHSTTTGVETLLGDIGDDIFTVDHDDTTVTGGSGADVIHLNVSGSANDVADLIITDFHADEGDKLVLDDLLVNPDNSLDDYLHFTTEGNDTVMEVSPQADGDVSQRVTFKDVDLFSLGSTDSDIINNLLDNGNIDHGG